MDLNPPGRQGITPFRLGLTPGGGDRWNNGGKIAAAEQIFGGRVRQYKEVQLTMFNQDVLTRPWCLILTIPMIAALCQPFYCSKSHSEEAKDAKAAHVCGEIRRYGWRWLVSTWFGVSLVFVPMCRGSNLFFSCKIHPSPMFVAAPEDWCLLVCMVSKHSRHSQPIIDPSIYQGTIIPAYHVLSDWPSTGIFNFLTK